MPAAPTDPTEQETLAKMKAEGMNTKRMSRLGEVYFTVVEEEDYTYSNDITDRPVEDGSIITDNVRNKPIEIKITGILTGKGAYPQQQLTMLRLYSLNGDILSYVGIQSFSRCVIENFENKHNSEVGNGITFDITLKEVKIAIRTEIHVGITTLKIPDIEALQDQLEAQQSANKKAATAAIRVNGMVTTGRKGTTTTTAKAATSKASKKY